MKTFDKVPVSIPCWQRDDIKGFENRGGGASEGLVITGNYPGKPRIGEQLGQSCVYNMWVQNGIKDIPADRMLYRRLMKES